MRYSLEIAARSVKALVPLGLLTLIFTGCGTLSSGVRVESSVLAIQAPAEPAPAELAIQPPAEPPTDVVLAQAPAEPEKTSADKPSDIGDVPEVEEYDPWEPFNEVTFEFNRKLDRYVLKPAAQVWNIIIPQPFQLLFASGLDNLGVGPRFVNNLLQAKWGGALREVSRFVINSTLGIAGLWDPAKDYWGIEKSGEDFGQTLGVWGVKPGPYLVLPFMAPLTVRDGIGKAVDSFLDPFFFVTLGTVERVAIKVGEILNDRALNIELFEGFEESVIDMYTSVRQGYLQRRERLIRE